MSYFSLPLCRSLDPVFQPSPESLIIIPSALRRNTANMKSFRRLLTPLALLLAVEAASQAGSSLLHACDELSVDHNDGVLSGKCRGTGDAVLTSVDLDQCLGWGPQAAHLGRPGFTPGLTPVRE